MTVYLGENEIENLYLGATEIERLYLGNVEVYGAGSITKVFDLTGALDADLTYARADTVATVIDSAGKLKKCASNEYRLQHTSAGIPLGFLTEVSRVNRFTNFSAVPTAVADFSVTGDATINVTTDAVAIAAAKLENVVTGNVFIATGGAGGGTVVLPGTTGSVSASSFSAYARVVSGTTANLSHNGSGALSAAFTNTAYQRILLENQIPSSTGVQMVFDIPAGTTIHFILPQIEVGPYASSPIVTAGAAATRQADNLHVASFNTKEYFNIDEMSIFCEYTPLVDVNMGGSAFSNYIFFSGVDTVVEGLGAYGAGTSTQILPLGVAPGAPAINATSPNNFETGFVKNQRGFAGISFVNGEKMTAFGDAFSNKYAGTFGTYTAANLNRLSIGHRFSSPSTILQNTMGIIHRVTVVNKYLTMRQQASRSSTRSRKFFAAGGQSNTLRNFTDAVVPNPNGKISFFNTLNQFWTTTDNFIVNGAWDGSRALKSGLTTPGWWYDNVTGDQGDALIRWRERVLAMMATGAECEFIIWDQGESDTGKNKADLKAAYLFIFGVMRATVGNVPVIMRRIGRRTPGSSNTHYQEFRELQSELAAENDWIHIAPDKIATELVDSVHLTQAGYVATATQWIRKALKTIGENVTGTVEPPKVIYAERNANVVTANIVYDTGANDFTGDKGFQLFDSGVEITGTFAKVDANKITYTLATTPTGTEVLYYGYGALTTYQATWADLIKDNSSYQLSMYAQNMPLPYMPYGPDKFADLVLWYDSDISTTVSQRTDLTANGNNAIQATPTLQPTIVSNALNGKDGLQFDGTDDNMSILTNAQLQEIKDEITFEFVIDGTPSSSFKVLFRNNTGGSRGFQIQNDSNGGSGSTASKLFVIVTTSAGSFTMPTRIDGCFDGNPHHCILRINNGVVDFFKDGVKTSMGSYTVGTNGFGSSQNWQHHGGDNTLDFMLAAYSRALSDADCLKKWQHAQARWDL